MALKLLIKRAENELRAEYLNGYWKINDIFLGSDQIHVTLNVYPDEDARRFNQTSPMPMNPRPVFSKGYQIPNAQISIQNLGELKTAVYTWLKTQPEFKDAVDC